MSGNRPSLAGLSVLVTRPEGQAEELITALTRRGAAAWHVPAIRIVDPPSFAALDRALAQAERYSWTVFTSVNGVTQVKRRLDVMGIPHYRGLRGGGKVAAIGPTTGQALRAWRVVPDLVPPEAVAESLLAALLATGVGAGDTILLPQPVESRDVLAAGLRAAGATVDMVPAYETVVNREGGVKTRRWLAGGTDKIALATSPSTVTGLLAMLDGEVETLRTIPLACIGPATAAAVVKLGLTPAFVADEHTNEGLIAALERYHTGVTA